MRHGRRTFGDMVAALALAGLAAACGGGEPAPLEDAEQAIAGAFCAEPTFSASRVSAFGTEAVLSARSSCGALAATYRFLVKAPGATQYTVVRDYGEGGDLTWDFAGQPPGRHTLAVWVRPAGSTAQYDATASAVLDVGDVCAAVTLESPFDPPALYATASATCSGAARPEYRFFAKPPGAAAFGELRPYSPDGEVVYGAGAPGRYEVLVYARASGNASAYEASATRSTLVGATCSSATLTTTYDGYGKVGLAATAACGGAMPELRFLARAPGTTAFIEVRPYGPEAGLAYLAEPAKAGRYEFQVWARAKGNASDWEAQATAATLVGTTCSAARLTAAYDGQALVDLSADATCAGGAPAEYRFLVRRPGASTFVEVRPYGPESRAPFFVPAGSAAGRYELKVYARAAGNASAYEAAATASALVGPTCSAATLVATYDGTSRVDLSATATCASPGEYRFLVRRPGAAAFTELRPYAPTASFGLDVAPSASGRWEFQVQARLPGNPSDYEATATASTFVGRACASAALSARLDGSSLVQLAASAACTNAPAEYRFFARRPGEATFAEVRPYGTEAGLPFPIHPFVAGRWEFKVFARAAGNPSDWEAVATASTFVGPSCPSATLAARFDGRYVVELSTQSTCMGGTQPEYRFAVRRPGAPAFAELRGYSPDPRFPYPIDPVVPGRYEFQVYVRAAGNPSDYEATAKAATLVGPTCSSAGLSTKSAQPEGPVDLVAWAGCRDATPEYRFLVRRPGTASFSQLRAWDKSPTLAFDPGVALPGKYELQVQARAVGNASEYEATAAATLFVGGTCSSTFLEARPDGSGAVNLASGATCTLGAVPEYRFLVKRPGDAGLAEARRWAGDPLFTLFPYPGVPGRYELVVQVRATGNVSDAEATASAAALLGRTCTGVSLAATFVGGGTRLSATAGCAFGAYPEYRFQVRGPGETVFLDLGPYSPEALAFHPSYPFRPGRYEFQVLARAAGNPSDYEALAKASVLVGETCTAATLTAALAPGASIVELAATGACASREAEYRFLVRRPGEAAFSELRGYGAEAKIPFFTSLVPPGRYEFQVWVRAVGNGSDQEAIASATTFLGAVCSAAALSTAPSMAFDGTWAVDLAASASCRFAIPEFRFLFRPPGSSAFRELRPYAAEARASLPVSPGMPPGRYELQVLVRAAGNATDESSATASALVGRACPGAALVATWYAGSGWLAAATPCQYGGPPEYRFLAKPPGATAFLEIRPYQPDPEAPILDRTPGRHEFQVQVRAAGNPSDYEGQATAATLVGDTCSSATLRSIREPTGPVRLEATASCLGGGAEYRFLYRRAGAAALAELRPYSMDPQLSWVIDGLAPGAYEVAVHARRVGNASAFEAAATLAVAIDPP